MKIGFLEPHLGVCGGIRRILEISNRLVEWGHEVYMYTPYGEACVWMDMLAEPRQLEQQKEDSLDICVANLESMWKDLRDADASVKVFYFLHYGVLYKEDQRPGRGVVECKDSYRQGFYHVANSNWTADHIDNEIGSRPIVVHGGLCHDTFYPVEVKKEYDVLCMGEDKREWKGTSVIKDACQLAGVEMEGYSGKGLPQSKMAEEYGKARVFVSGSDWEGWNQPALEAMACGIPVVKTDDGGSRDYAFHRYNCLYVPQRDPEAMAEAIKEVMGDSELRDMLVRNGLKTAKLFNWDDIAKHFESVIKEAYEKNS